MFLLGWIQKLSKVLPLTGLRFIFFYRRVPSYILTIFFFFKKKKSPLWSASSDGYPLGFVLPWYDPHLKTWIVNTRINDGRALSFREKHDFKRTLS